MGRGGGRGVCGGGGEVVGEAGAFENNYDFKIDLFNTLGRQTRGMIKYILYSQTFRR